MVLELNIREDEKDLRPKIMVFGVGGAGGNAVNNMISKGLEGVGFIVANTDSQALRQSEAECLIQLGSSVTQGLGAGADPKVGDDAANESLDEIIQKINGAHMCFITAGMGGGTGTGASPVIARAAKDLGILTVGVVTKPFHFEGSRRMELAESGVEQLQQCVDTLIVIPNQNLFRVANEKTTFIDAFMLADDVLFQGVRSVTDLMVKPGLVNLDFADVRSIMNGMGKAMMGTGEESGEGRSIEAAKRAIANPLLDEVSLKGARGVIVSICGGNDLTLFEVDEAADYIRKQVDPDANIIVGATFDASLEGAMSVSVVATGIDMDNQDNVLDSQGNSGPSLGNDLRDTRYGAGGSSFLGTSSSFRSSSSPSSSMGKGTGLYGRSSGAIGRESQRSSYLGSGGSSSSLVGGSRNKLSDIGSKSSTADRSWRMRSETSVSENLHGSPKVKVSDKNSISSDNASSSSDHRNASRGGSLRSAPSVDKESLSSAKPVSTSNRSALSDAGRQVSDSVDDDSSFSYDIDVGSIDNSPNDRKNFPDLSAGGMLGEGKGSSLSSSSRNLAHNIGGAYDKRSESTNARDGDVDNTYSRKKNSINNGTSLGTSSSVTSARSGGSDGEGSMLGYSEEAKRRFSVPISLRSNGVGGTSIYPARGDVEGDNVSESGSSVDHYASPRNGINTSSLNRNLDSVSEKVVGDSSSVKREDSDVSSKSFISGVSKLVRKLKGSPSPAGGGIKSSSTTMGVGGGAAAVAASLRVNSIEEDEEEFREENYSLDRGRYSEKNSYVPLSSEKQFGDDEDSSYESDSHSEFGDGDDYQKIDIPSFLRRQAN